MISMITAQELLGGIGINNKLPWGKPIKEDMKWFRKHTLNKSVLMGRKTYESIPFPLKDRQCIVLTTDTSYKIDHDNYTVINNIDDIVKQYQFSNEEIVVIGGEQIYKLFIPYISLLYLTLVYKTYECDAFFPMIDIHRRYGNGNNLYEEYVLDEESNTPLRFNIVKY